jgi:Rrf2 family protein
MQITRQADYAIRAIHYLAKVDPNQRSATSQIAAEKHIPPSFLAKIISQLSIAGLIHTRPPEDITVLDVVEAIDGPIALNECTFTSVTSCPFGDDCPIRDLWIDTQAELVERLRNTTFEQFIRPKSAA